MGRGGGRSHGGRSHGSRSHASHARSHHTTTHHTTHTSSVSRNRNRNRHKSLFSSSSRRHHHYSSSTTTTTGGTVAPDGTPSTTDTTYYDDEPSCFKEDYNRPLIAFAIIFLILTVLFVILVLTIPMHSGLSCITDISIAEFPVCSYSLESEGSTYFSGENVTVYEFDRTARFAGGWFPFHLEMDEEIDAHEYVAFTVPVRDTYHSFVIDYTYRASDYVDIGLLDDDEYITFQNTKEIPSGARANFSVKESSAYENGFGVLTIVVLNKNSYPVTIHEKADFLIFVDYPDAARALSVVNESPHEWPNSYGSVFVLSYSGPRKWTSVELLSNYKFDPLIVIIFPALMGVTLFVFLILLCCRCSSLSFDEAGKISQEMIPQVVAPPVVYTGGNAAGPYPGTYTGATAPTYVDGMPPPDYNGGYSSATIPASPTAIDPSSGMVTGPTDIYGVPMQAV